MRSFLLSTFIGIALLAASTFSLKAQNYTVSGYIKDVQSGEVLLGAVVYAPKVKAGATANTYGFYSLTLPASADSVTLVYSYAGYKTLAKKLVLDKDIRLNVNLMLIQMEEVTITAKANDNVEKPQMGVIDIPIQQVKELPAVFGEKDLFKVLQLLPGVQGGSEASSGFYVRGGAADENLVLLDEAIIYNPFHLAGFFSTFNGDALKSVTLIKGGFPAQYGGRLSSIIDISMKDGNDKEFHGEGGLGLISSRLTLEGPIKKNKSSFMVSGRRTYLDVLMKPFLPKGESAGYYFYDLNGKVNYIFSDKDRVYLSGYLGKDAFFSGDTSINFNVGWGNKSATARWNHLFSQKLFSNLTLFYNDYLFTVGETQKNLTASLTTGLRDNAAKLDFEWFPAVKHLVKFGASYTYQTFIPSSFEGKIGNIDTANQVLKFVHQGGVYINDEYTINEKMALNLGVRESYFIFKNTHYFGFEPRVTAKYSLNRNTSLKASYTWMNQYIQLLSNSTLAAPTDLWIPSSDIVKPQQSQQASAGIFRNFLNNAYETSVEVYYKTMDRMIEFKPGADVFLNPNIENELVFGKGWSYGSEFFVKRNVGRITGWVGYTLSWAWRSFPDIENGKAYPATYDRRHDLSFAGVYNFNKSWAFSAIFVYGTGHSQTVQEGYYTVPVPNNGAFFGGDGFSPFTQTAIDYGSKNGYKLPPYNRLDLGIKHTTHHKKFDTELRLDIYNVYSRRNPYFVYVTNDFDQRSNADKPALRQVSLFPMIPSLSLNFKF